MTPASSRMPCVAPAGAAALPWVGGVGGWLLYRSSSSTRGSSTAALILRKKVTASLPSISR